MFVSPTGGSPSPVQVRELDDSFFGADPHGYFLSRIESLIAHADGANATVSDGVGRQFALKLGWERDGDALLASSADARELQVAIDAASLRQHLAEAVLRLWLALLQTKTARPGTASIWEALTSTPNQTSAIFDAIQKCEDWDTASVHLELLLPKQHWPQYETDPKMRQAVDVMGKWFDHAVTLLTRSDIHLASANNKYKHGLAVRMRNDVRIGFLPSDAVPAEGDSIPFSAVESEIVLFDKPFVEYLAKGPFDGEGKHGLELTHLRLDTPTLLVEATMLATLYGAMFHVAAARHAAWSATVGKIAPYPSLPLGPTPARLLGKAVTGMRSPVTLRPDGSAPTRGPGIGFNHGEFVSLAVDYEGRRTMTFEDDGGSD
ncbi:hypothetical protein ABE437_04830 [Isoptericola cucumis]|uniref:hypothetical protein n=1 Tax=Isoptericola cucumis TaxID=1776856 RepID=UPI003207EA3F